jgi:hypothetical protein
MITATTTDPGSFPSRDVGQIQFSPAADTFERCWSASGDGQGRGASMRLELQPTPRWACPACHPDGGDRGDQVSIALHRFDPDRLTSLVADALSDTLTDAGWYR